MVASVTAFGGPAAKRPPVDLQAMREAMNSAEDADVPFPSAASYAHFLRARLAHHEGAHRQSLDELRLALASDDDNVYLMTELAEQWARLSDLERAEAQLKRVLDKAPDYPQAQLMMGRVLYESRKTTRAKAHLSRAIRLMPTSPDAYLVLTQLWLDQGKVDEAVKVVEELGAAVPGEPIGFRRLGLALAERGDPTRAEKLLLRAVDRDPGDFEAWVTLARIYETTARLPKALEAYGRALERDSDNREALLAAGRLALRMNAVADARAYFDQLLSLSKDPEQVVKVAFSFLAVRQYGAAADVLEAARRQLDEPRLHFYAGLVHEKRRSWSKAIEAFDAVPRDSGELALEARLHRGMCLSMQGQHRQAVELFRALSEERGDLPGLEVAWARALERAGQPKEAEAQLVKAFSARPSAEVYEALGGFYARVNRNAEAAVLFASALARQPRDEALIFALSAALERKGEWARAIDRMRTVLEVSPANAAALNFIGYTMADHGGDLDEAERLVRAALEERPDSAAFLDSLGWVLFKRGDYERAVETLERAVTEAPDEATLLEHLGDAALGAGKRAKAAEAYRRAVQVLADDPDAAERPQQRAELERKLKSAER
ncbi:MAG: tetratricopeptide repeat protein [Archangium sp.]|nr:tetratricopeptide repeat protein [Archangium sp.]